eukprot:TRINITY_DN22170_c1_g2_i1.p1 TRINITY_DN22170_c1_g2~~TRINITY_DN22170_c1_g2_i1.p1  ORF type:complete len:1052 (+),score=267.53 TRINITY_DN22170_c1_g2_i1:49-3204(+)
MLDRFRRSDSTISTADSNWDDDTGPQPPRVVSLRNFNKEAKADEEPLVEYKDNEEVETYWEPDDAWYRANIMRHVVENGKVTYDVIWEGGASCTPNVDPANIRKPGTDPPSELTEGESGSPGPSAAPPPSPSPKGSVNGLFTPHSSNPSSTHSDRNTEAIAQAPDIFRCSTVAIDEELEHTLMVGDGGSPSPSSSPSPVHSKRRSDENCKTEDAFWKDRITELYAEHNQNPCDLAMLMKKFDGSLKELYTELKEGFDAEKGLHLAYQGRAEVSVRRSRANSGAWESPKNSVYLKPGRQGSQGSLTPTRRYSMTLKSPNEAAELSAAAAILSKELERESMSEKQTIFANMDEYKPSRRSSVKGEAGDLISASDLDRVWGVVRTDSVSSMQRMPRKRDTEPVSQDEVSAIMEEVTAYWNRLLEAVCKAQGRVAPKLPDNTDYLHEFRRICKKYSLDPDKERPMSEMVARCVRDRNWAQAVKEFYIYHNPKMMHRIPTLLNRHKGNEEELFRDLNAAYNTRYNVIKDDNVSNVEEAISEMYPSDLEGDTLGSTWTSSRETLHTTQPKQDTPPSNALFKESSQHIPMSERWTSRLLTLYTIKGVPTTSLSDVLELNKGKEEAFWRAEVTRLGGLPDFTSPRARITAIFARHAPDMLNTVSKLLDIHKGKEEAYISSLVDTYGKEPSFTFAMRRESVTQHPTSPLLDKAQCLSVGLVALSAALLKVLTRPYLKTPPLAHCKRPSPVQIPLSGGGVKPPSPFMGSRTILNSPPVSLLSPKRPPLSPKTPPSPYMKGSGHTQVQVVAPPALGSPRNGPPIKSLCVTNTNVTNVTNITGTVVRMETSQRVELARMEDMERGRLVRLCDAEVGVLQVVARWEVCFKKIEDEELARRDMFEREETALRLGRLQWFASFIKEQDLTGREILVVQAKQQADAVEHALSPVKKELENVTAANESAKRVRLRDNAAKMVLKQRERGPSTSPPQQSARRRRATSRSSSGNDRQCFVRKPQQAVNISVPKPRPADKGGVPPGSFSRPAPYLLKNPLVDSQVRKRLSL